MRVAVVTFDRFNEIDTFVALGIISRLGVQVDLVAPSDTVTSMNGVQTKRTAPLAVCSEVDAVLIGSGLGTADAIGDASIMQQLQIDPQRQWIGAQCSGALVLAKLGLLKDNPACTDATTRPMLERAGVTVLEKPFHSAGRVATAGGCLASHYLATWVLRNILNDDAATKGISYVAPVGEEADYVDRAMRVTRS